MYSYRDKKLFLQSFHPLTMMAYALVLVYLALASNHPVLLLSLYVVLLVHILLVDAWAAYKTFALFLLFMTVLIILINPLFSRSGSTVLFSLPAVPVLGQIPVSLEAILYGVDMSLRLLVVMTVFFLYNQSVNPDRAFVLLARLAPGSAMLVTLATRLIPYLAVRFREIKEVQQTRGVDFDRPGLKHKISSYYPLLKVLLLNSLENSLNLAEAIQSRGYGSGPRSYYSGVRVQLRDVLVLVSSLAALALGVAMLTLGWGRYEFYPELSPLYTGPQQVCAFACLVLATALPALLNWGWKSWPYLRWKL